MLNELKQIENTTSKLLSKVVNCDIWTIEKWLIFCEKKKLCDWRSLRDTTNKRAFWENNDDDRVSNWFNCMIRVTTWNSSVIQSWSVEECDSWTNTNRSFWFPIRRKKDWWSTSVDWKCMRRTKKFAIAKIAFEFSFDVEISSASNNINEYDYHRIRSCRCVLNTSRRIYENRKISKIDNKKMLCNKRLIVKRIVFVFDL